MLVLSRQRDESVRIGDNISVTVVDIRGDKVKLGFTAPVDVPVHRQEVCDRIQREGRCSHGQADQISEGNFRCRLCGARGSRVGKRVRWTVGPGIENASAAKVEGIQASAGQAETVLGQSPKAAGGSLPPAG